MLNVVQKMESVVHDTWIEHGVERHLPCAMKMEGVQCVIEHGVERRLTYVVCVENGGCGARNFHRAWCGASTVICCVYEKCKSAMSDRARCGASPAICVVYKRWRGCSVR